VTKLSPAPIFDFRDTASREALGAWREAIAKSGEQLVFTNGVFDLLHAGHVSYLFQARNLGDALIIGLNSDESVRRIKGPNRPIQSELDRATLLAALKPTDAIAIFDEDTPLELITFVVPNVMVKGGDYTPETMIGREVVERAGGRVLPLPFIEGRSTTSIVENIVERYGRK
jgi:D-beta-D-heptose 7-phosphate kinase/D-beta-D-heptose 1-phosphate adenosyltransferase